jgi:8-oxo-dGTP diphosphatase
VMQEIIKIGAVVLTPSRDAMLVGRKLGREMFIIPGGKPEAGETDEETLARELFEECAVSVTEVTYFGTFFERAAFEDAQLQMRVYEVQIAGTPSASSEIEELRWISAIDLERGVPLGSTLTEHVMPRLVARGDLVAREP